MSNLQTGLFSIYSNVLVLWKRQTNYGHIYRNRYKSRIYATYKRMG